MTDKEWVEEERKRFERIITRPPYEQSIETIQIDRIFSGQYKDHGVQVAWELWLAAKRDAVTVDREALNELRADIRAKAAESGGLWRHFYDRLCFALQTGGNDEPNR